MNCPQCQRPLTSAVPNCPYCGAVLAVPPNIAQPVTRRVSLTGEVIETPVSAPQNTPFSPVSPLPRVVQDIPAEPNTEQKEQMWMRGIGVVLLVVLAAGMAGGLGMYRHYSATQKKYEKELHIDLTTPQSAAKEVMYSLQNGAPLRLYRVTQFAEEAPLQTENAFFTVAEQTKRATAFSQGYRYGEERNPRVAATLRTISDIQIGTPLKLDTQHTDVPVQCKATFEGQEQTYSGVARLLDCSDGKWRLDCSRISPTRPDAASAQIFSQTLSDLFHHSIPGLQ